MAFNQDNIQFNAPVDICEDVLKIEFKNKLSDNNAQKNITLGFSSRNKVVLYIPQLNVLI